MKAFCHRTVQLDSPKQCLGYQCSMWSPEGVGGCLEVITLQPVVELQVAVDVTKGEPEYPESKAPVRISWAADNTIYNAEDARFNADLGQWEIKQRILGGWDWVALELDEATAVSWDYTS